MVVVVDVVVVFVAMAVRYDDEMVVVMAVREDTWG